MTFWVTDWLRAFGLTLLLELALAVPLLAAVEPRFARRIAAVVTANLATHPLVWFLFPGLALRWPARLALSEAWALIAEAIIYLTIWPALRLRRAFLVSLLANAASAAAGLILMRFLGRRELLPSSPAACPAAPRRRSGPRRQIYQLVCRGCEDATSAGN